MKIKDYFQSKVTERGSSSVLWFHIANTAITYVYILVGLAVARMPSPNLEGLAFLTFGYIAVVTSNKLANKFLEIKYGVSGPTTTTVDKPK